MNKDLEKILFNENELAAAVKRLGSCITADFAGKPLVCVCILKGSMIFAADLLRSIDLDLRFDVMQVSSYGAGSVSSGKLKIIKDLSVDVAGANVLIIEDIIDSGVTMSALVPYIREKGAESVRVCSLLSKPDRRAVNVAIDYLGYEIPDEFVVGYGLDYGDRYRNLPYVGILKRACYE